jgi:predicted nucleic acid-binding protein
VRFWASSAILPLLVGDPGTAAAQRLLEQDPDVVTWWGTAIECAAVIGRGEREGALDASAASTAFQRLDGIASAWSEVVATDRVRETATRLLRGHPLGASDALEIAAAIVASEDRPRSLPFVTLDDHVAGVADREGFRVVRPR